MPGDLDTSNPEPLQTKSPPQLPQAADRGWNLLKTFKSLRFPEDGQGNVWSIPVVITDPETLGMLPQAIRVHAMTAAGLCAGAQAYAIPMLYNPIAGDLEAQRTPTVFKTFNGLTTAATVWTPAAGKKVRVLGGTITLAGPALAAASTNVLTLLDVAAAFWSMNFYCPLAAASLSTVVIPLDFGKNGFLVAAADDTIEMTLQSNLTAGAIAVSLWGTEE